MIFSSNSPSPMRMSQGLEGSAASSPEAAMAAGGSPYIPMQSFKSANASSFAYVRTSPASTPVQPPSVVAPVPSFHPKLVRTLRAIVDRQEAVSSVGEHQELRKGWRMAPSSDEEASGGDTWRRRGKAPPLCATPTVTGGDSPLGASPSPSPPPSSLAIGAGSMAGSMSVPFWWREEGGGGEEMELSAMTMLEERREMKGESLGVGDAQGEVGGRGGVRPAMMVYEHMIYDRRPWKCREMACGKCFKNWQTLKMHLKTHDGSEGGSAAMMREHYTPVRGVYRAGKNKKIPVQCSKCNKVFVGLYELRRHWGRKHSLGPKQLSCLKCDKKYHIEADLREHQKACGEKFHCPICGGSFIYPCNFAQHMKTRPDCMAGIKNLPGNSAALLPLSGLSPDEYDKFPTWDVSRTAASGVSSTDFWKHLANGTVVDSSLVAVTPNLDFGSRIQKISRQNLEDSPAGSHGQSSSYSAGESPADSPGGSPRCSGNWTGGNPSLVLGGDLKRKREATVFGKAKIAVAGIAVPSSQNKLLNGFPSHRERSHSMMAAPITWGQAVLESSGSLALPSCTDQKETLPPRSLSDTALMTFGGNLLRGPSFNGSPLSLEEGEGGGQGGHN